MPNWCFNTLTVKGKQVELDAFFKQNSTKEQKLTFEALLPTPEKVLNAKLSKGDTILNENYWYGWCVKHWGTKWDLDDEVSVDESPGHVIYSFSTAWSPPIPWLDVAVTKYPQLEFELIYEEGGNCCYGVARSKDGEFEIEEMERIEYLERFNEDYRDEKYHVENMSSKDAVDYLLENEDMGDADYYPDLEAFALEQVADDDLPLLVSKSWWNGDLEGTFKARLAGDSTQEPNKEETCPNPA